MGYIYKITNDINNKVYIGQTINTIDYRFKNHINDAISNQNTQNKFHNAIKKLGAEHFKTEQIEECPNEKLNEREQYWIKFYDSVNNGYNTTWGGSCGIHYDRNEILKLWNQGYNIQKISNIIGMDRGLLGQVLHTLNIPQKEITKRHYEATRTQTKNHAVYQINPITGDIIKQWERISDIERELHIYHSSIVNCCLLKSQSKTAGGYAWRYVENYNPELDKQNLIQYTKRVPNNSKTILQYDKNHNLINTFINATEAEKITGINKSSITKYCRGERKDSRGFIWEYENK